MIVSHEWLKDFVPHNLSADEVGNLLSRHTVTLDGIERIGVELAAIVVGQVIEAGPHPNSDHLWVTKVDDGSGTLLDVVCGAPVVVKGQKYPFARTGVTLPGGLKIEKRKIRGETSNGMLCSARELGLGDEHEGILALDTVLPPGTSMLEIIPAADAQINLDVPPNRPDLLSHLGVAREISALANKPMRTPHAIASLPTTAPANATGDTSASHAGISVEIQDTASCPLYVAVVIRGVQVGPSPEWLVKRLASIGARSINNVVDATNYILFGFGQPVHAFDLSKLAGQKIVVRPTRDGESIVTLDGAERKLATGTTVICDGERPTALAGVMGGKASEVTEATTDILLEVAMFDARFVRRVRNAVGLSTEASYRYERGVDEGFTRQVAGYAAALIANVAGGEVSTRLEVGRAVPTRAPVNVRMSRVHQVLGVKLSHEDVAVPLTCFGLRHTSEHAAIVKVQPPTWRHDVSTEIDMIEEIARFHGYDSLPDDLRAGRPGTVPDHPIYVRGRRVRDTLVSMGLAETRSMPFTAKGDANSPRVLNPLAEDEPFLRASLLDTLANRAEYNLSRMQGNVRLFEIGNAFLPANDRLPREETRAAALIMGSRRPPHFTEPTPPSFDAWDAKSLAERMVHAAFPGEQSTLTAGEGDTLWRIAVDSRGEVGTVRRVPLDRPVWASEAFGVELTLGVIESADVAPPKSHVHATAPHRETSVWSNVKFRAIPVMPAAEFDLALIVPDRVEAGTVERVLKAAGGELLERVVLFDEFRGAGIPSGSRSLAWRLTFRHPERTLRDKEIDGRRSRLLESLKRELGIEPRAS